MTREEIYNRVKSINDDLRAQGMDFDQIVQFWDEVFEKVKQKQLLINMMQDDEKEMRK